MILLILHRNHDVHQHAGNPHIAGIQRPGLHYLFYLDEYGSSAVFHCLRDGKHSQVAAFFFHRNIAPLVRISSPDKCIIQTKMVVFQIFFSVNLQQMNDFFFCNAVQPASVNPWIYKCL